MIASAMGMSNTAEAMAFLKDETKEATFELEKYGISQEEAEEITKKAAGPMKMLQLTFEKMLPNIQAFVTAIQEGAETVAGFIEGNEELIFYPS